MNANEYKQLMALGESGTKLETKAFDELTAYATKRKVRRPKPEWLVGWADTGAATIAPTTAKATTPTRYENKGAQCSVDGCGKAAVAKGMCSADYTRLVHRADPANREKAREASRRYAAKKRAEREAAAAAKE